MFVFIKKYNRVRHFPGIFSDLLIFFLFSLSNNDAFTDSSQEESNKILNSCLAKKVIYLS